MVFCQIALLYFWVKLKNLATAKHKYEKNSAPTETESSMIDTTDGGEEKKEEEVVEFENAFWYWNKFSNYVWCICSMILLFAALTWLGQDSATFADSIGMLSSAIEVS